MGTCRMCQGKIVKAGKQKNNTQRYRCTQCGKYQQCQYQYLAYKADTRALIAIYLEGCGIRSLGRIFGISPGTVLNKIRGAAARVSTRTFQPGMCYEIDEVQTYVGRKSNKAWIGYALERVSRRVLGFMVGNRSIKGMKGLISKVLETKPKRVYTDYLNIYPALIPKGIHKPGRYVTNRIERANLTLRTHLKRLVRRTICFSKSIEMLKASLCLYFCRGYLRQG